MNQINEGYNHLMTELTKINVVELKNSLYERALKLEMNELLALVACLMAIIYPFTLLLSKIPMRKPHGTFNIATLYIYPIKSCRRVSVQRAR